MARSAATSVENNFVNGWITEATGLNFPENAVVATENMVYKSTGAVSRRLGIDRELGGASLLITPSTTDLFTEYLWENVAGNGTKSFFLQQRGAQIYVFNVGLSGGLTNNLHGIIDFSSLALTLTDFEKKPYQFTSGLGRLFVTHPHLDPIVITYDTELNQLQPQSITIQVRDVVGIPGPPRGRSPIQDMPARYDLKNQGWPDYPIDHMRQISGLYPSDYDVWWLYKVATTTSNGAEIFLPDVAYNAGILNNVDRGNSPAPKGSYILNDFYQDRSLVSGIGSITPVSAGVHRPSTTTFHAGRVWFAGVAHQDWASKVYFSQILESPDQAGRCYQQNDPTTQYTPDLLASDGGTIVIPEVGAILKLWSMDASLFVIATNGVWQITGSQGIGFSAVDYTVKRISKQETLSAMSFVNVFGMPMWWGVDGIYTLQPDKVGNINLQVVTEKKIETYYEELSSTVKSYAKGAFHSEDRIVQWLYREEDGADIRENQSFTKILVLDVSSGAFYTFTLNTELVSVRGIHVAQGFGTQDGTDFVRDNLGAVVTALDASSVLVETSTAVPISAAFKYTATYNANRDRLTYGEIRNENYLDWEALGYNTQIPSSFDAGYRIRGDAQRKFQSNYTTFYCESLEGTQFEVKGKWNFANSSASGRWSSPQVLTMPLGDHDYFSRRVKIRGHGTAMQYSVAAVGQQPLTLIGWSTWDTINGSV